MKIEPVVLIGNTVQLEPLREEHIKGLARVGLEPKIWQFMRYSKVETEEQMGQWVRELLELQAMGTDLPFAVIQRATGKPIGCTRYLNIDIDNRAVEIGGTWYGLEYQGTLVNTECKYMLIKHAFEVLGCVRVWFKTDQRNKRSQHALEKLGVVKEGVLRNHMILLDGYIRNSVVYSLLPEEWPQVRQQLEDTLTLAEAVNG